MDQGPDKMRRRFTAVPKLLSCSFLMTAAQLQTFETFYDTTIVGGSDSFDWTHPRLGTTISCRFVQVPTFVPVGLYWRVSAEIEVLP